jgi:O-antigen/teichoic acid export membrane protein
LAGDAGTDGTKPRIDVTGGPSMTEMPPRAEAPGPLPSSLELEGRILRNTGWVALGHGGRQVASLLTMLILARLLEPKDFGLVALAWSVLYFTDQIQETGVASALIHRRGDVERAAASALIYTPLFSLLFYGVVFAFAPLIARFLHAPDLTDVLRVMALVLIFHGLRVVPAAILERDLNFRSKVIADLIATFGQICVFLGLAFAGLGVWSLVAGYVVGAAIEAALYWLLVPWRPSPRKANYRALLELLRFGRFVGAANILAVVSNTIDNIVISRVLGPSPLGLYSVAFRLAEFPNSVIGHIVGRTMFSVYSLVQHDLTLFRHAYVRNLQRVALFSLPISVGLAIAAEPIVAVLLGEKWLAAVPALRILAIYALIKPFGGVAAEALKGVGKPELNLALGVLFVVVVIPALIVLTRRFGITGAAASVLIAGLVTVLSALAITAREVRLQARELLSHLAPSLLCSALLAATLGALIVPSHSMAPAAALALLVSVGLVVYVLATALFARGVVVPMLLSLRSGREL